MAETSGPPQATQSGRSVDTVAAPDGDSRPRTVTYILHEVNAVGSMMEVQQGLGFGGLGFRV